MEQKKFILEITDIVLSFSCQLDKVQNRLMMKPQLGDLPALDCPVESLMNECCLDF